MENILSCYDCLRLLGEEVYHILLDMILYLLLYLNLFRYLILFLVLILALVLILVKNSRRTLHPAAIINGFQLAIIHWQITVKLIVDSQFLGI